MSEPKARRWFQFSLTTCTVMMVVAGLLVWANVHPRIRLGISNDLSLLEATYGWPTVACWASWFEPYQEQRPSSVPEKAEFGFRYIGLATNMLCCLGILAGIAFFCEHRAKLIIVRPNFCPFLTEILMGLLLVGLLSTSLYFIYYSPFKENNGLYYYSYGWPFYSNYHDETVAGSLDAERMNICFGLFWLILVYLCSEYLIRRRERKQQEPQP